MLLSTYIAWSIGRGVAAVASAADGGAAGALTPAKLMATVAARGSEDTAGPPQQQQQQVAMMTLGLQPISSKVRGVLDAAAAQDGLRAAAVTQ